tara:strand:- start:770 stop:1360 length:591 start_codon:yes stop_codon:yes gene_type:complete
MYKTIKIGKIRTSRIELIDLAKAWLAISLAFTIASTGLRFDASFLLIMLISAFTVGIGFLFHELAHKFVAQRYGCQAEFRALDQMLFLAVAMSFLGFIFAAPGAVMLSGNITRKENGIISAAGPLTNFVLALIFLGFSFSYPVWDLVWMNGFQINLWLGLFNMIPFGNFDGKKILAWHRYIWAGMVIFGVYFLFFF